MTNTVVDACMFGPLIIPDEAGDLHIDLLPILARGGAIAPANWRLEVLNLARIAVRRGRLSLRDADDALLDVADFSIRIDDQTNHHAWGATRILAIHHDLTAYDAAYLELAKRADASLLTRDGALRAAAAKENVPLISL